MVTRAPQGLNMKTSLKMWEWWLHCVSIRVRVAPMDWGFHRRAAPVPITRPQVQGAAMKGSWESSEAGHLCRVDNRQCQFFPGTSPSKCQH